MKNQITSIVARLKRAPSRLLVDPLEPVIPAIAGYPRVKEGVPPDCRVYVIADIHGRIDLLREKHAQIKADLARNGVPAKPVLIYLGDYIDGGGSSREVIETVMAKGPGGIETVALMGNHEKLLLDFLEDADAGNRWLSLFGGATLESYGVPAPQGQPGHEELVALQASLRAALPDDHLRFLKSLRHFHVIGDYAFVHAGIRPGTPLADQKPEDLLWIRDEFLGSRARHEKVIVHGHSYSRCPRVRAHRIGIDIGSFFTGKLTCLVLEGDTHRFL